MIKDVENIDYFQQTLISKFSLFKPFKVSTLNFNLYEKFSSLNENFLPDNKKKHCVILGLGSKPLRTAYCR